MEYLILTTTSSFDYFNSLIIPIIVAVVSGLVTSYNTSKSFRNEIRKMQNETSMKGLIGALELAVNIIFNIEKLSKDKNLENKLRDMIHSLLTYGNSDTISVTASLMRYNYDSKRDKGNEPLVFYAIIASFIKMNVTGVWIDPLKFLEAKLTDFVFARDDLRKAEIILKKITI